MDNNFCCDKGNFKAILPEESCIQQSTVSAAVRSRSSRHHRRQRPQSLHRQCFQESGELRLRHVKNIPINPGRSEVFGLKAYPSIVDVPGELPLALIAVNTQTVLSVVEDVGKKGVKAA